VLVHAAIGFTVVRKTELDGALQRLRASDKPRGLSAILLQTKYRYLVSEPSFQPTLSNEGFCYSYTMETTERPWGTYTVIDESDTFKVKRITVEPGQRLSYQTHEHRSEYWTIVKGHGTVTLEDGEEKRVQVGDAIYIEKNDPHRISNVGESPLVFIEVQLGDYLGEDDIVRLEDDYNRE